MVQFVRVKDKDTGHEYSVREDLVREDAVDVIDKPAETAVGAPLPPKPNRPLDTLRADDGTPLADKKVADIRKYVDDHSIDVGEASKRDDLLAAVADAEAANADLA